MSNTLDFTNWYLALGKRLQKISVKVIDAREHEKLSIEEIELLRILYPYYKKEIITFGKEHTDCMDMQIYPD